MALSKKILEKALELVVVDQYKIKKYSEDEIILLSTDNTQVTFTEIKNPAAMHGIKNEDKCLNKFQNG